MKGIGEILKHRNIHLETANPVLQGGFTQLPNFVLREPALSVGAKLTYAILLSYAWHNDHCFEGQDQLAVDVGLSRSRVSQLFTELENIGLVTIQRRGQGKTNLYTIHFQIISGQVVQNQPLLADSTDQAAEMDYKRNIILATNNPMIKGGFTQMPNFILKAADISPGAKITYALFLSYAWHNEFCFPGQERLGFDMGLSQSRASQLVQELEKAGLIGIHRNGQGKTNDYTINFQVQRTPAQFQRRNYQMLIS